MENSSANAARNLLRFSLGRKIGLIAAFCLLPIALLIWLFVAQTQKDIVFAGKEIEGTRYLASVWPVFSAAARRASQADGDSVALESMREAGGLFAERLQTEAFASALAKSITAKASATEILAQGQRSIQKIGDMSNLILDPDLDTYYLMDAAVLRLPELVAAASSVNTAFDHLAQKEKPGFDDNAKLILAIGRFNAAAAPVYAAYEAAFQANTGELKQKLASTVARALSATAAFRAVGDSASARLGQSLPVSEISVTAGAAYNGLLVAADETWQATNAQLAELLRNRIARLQSAAVWKLGLVAAAMAVAAALMLMLVHSIQRPIRLLVAAMARLRTGDTSFETPYIRLDSEVGDIARALEASRQSAAALALARQAQDETQRQELARAAEMAAITRAMSKIVAAGHQGDFSHRLPEQVRDETMRELVHGMNELTSTIDDVLTRTMSVVASIADGDLTQRIEAAYQGNFLKLKNDINRMIEQLRTITAGIGVVTFAVQGAAGEISSGINDLSTRTQQQATSLEETSAAMEEMAATVHQNARNATQASVDAAAARNLAEGGNKVASEAIAAMDRISDSTRQINEIMALVEEISFQTNILALNAAVEAARAGDSGRGFAVVATEVRALSQRAGQSLKDVRSLVSTATGNVVEGSELVRRAGGTLNEIAGSVQRVANVIADISTASQEQASSVDQICRVVSDLDEMTQLNAALVEESNSALHSTKSQIDELQKTVAFFKTGTAAPAAAPMARAALAQVSSAGSNPVHRQQASLQRKLAASGLRPQASLATSSSDVEWQEF